MTLALAPATAGKGSIEGTEDGTSDESGNDVVALDVSTCILIRVEQLFKTALLLGSDQNMREQEESTLLFERRSGMEDVDKVSLVLKLIDQSERRARVYREAADDQVESTREKERENENE